MARLRNSTKSSGVFGFEGEIRVRDAEPRAVQGATRSERETPVSSRRDESARQSIAKGLRLRARWAAG